MSDIQKAYLTVRETARRLNVHENTVRNWTRQGLLESARVPGTKFHRFDEDVVERLRRQRGAPVSSAQSERRTFGPELVDATQLHQWAETREAQQKFPELVRRLLASTPGVTNISVRAGEGIAASGWDGRADSPATPFLPAGRLFLEIGVGSGPGAKADLDWGKRRNNPLEATPSQSIFVFMTPRRWHGKAAWAEARRQEHVFADVRVLDADDLQGWLETIPAVHHWISEELGRNPRGAETLEHWWHRFRTQTQPPLPAQLFLAGRNEELERLTDQLRGAPSVITVQSLWKEDTLAFVAAAIQDFKPPESVRPTVIVSSAEVWARVIEQPGRMTLIPLFGDPDIARALTQGHHIVLVSGRDEIAMGPVVNLPRPHRQVVSDALQAAGIDSGPAYRLAALARRSMPALIRSIARDPRFKIPPWARPPASDTLAPLVLVGSWTASEQDRALAKRMADAPWGKVEKALTEWTATDDPPFVRSATEWHLASAEEAFRLFARVFTHGDLARWHKIAAEVLLEPDPVGELPPDERPTAGLRGVARKYSEVLRAGVARGVAVIGSLEGEKLADDVSCADHARAIVRDVLAAANANPSGLSWRSLSDVLPRLAEAAPEVFLDALHEDLNREQPLLGSMFQDGGQGSWLYSASPHTGLLWALENLCWSPAYIADAARALARLCQIDPGGRLGNRPIASLQSVLVGWVRHNSASLPTRVKVLEAIVAQFPDVAWPLLLRLWPATHAVSSPPSEPHFRDWTPETRSVPIAEWIEYIGHVVRLALGLSVNNPLRCAELAEHLGPLPPSDLHRVLDFLDEAAKPSTLSHSDRLIMWERIHKEASRHRRFSQAKWSMGDEPLSRLERIASRLEPTDSVERFAYLFDWHPALGDVALDDHVSYDRQLESLRVAAIERTLSLGSPEALRSLARRSPVPSHFGMTLGRVSKDEHDAELLSWLDDDNEKIRESSAYWASQKLRDHGVTWLQRTLAAPSMTLARRATLVAGAPATAEMWQVIETDPELPKMYWQRMNPLGVDALGAEQASRQLIAHDRAWDAVDMLAMVLYRSRDTSTTTTSITPALVQEVLNSAHKSGSKTALSPSLGYDLGQLLDYLEDNNTPIEDLAKYEFQFFRLLQDWSHRRPSALFRAMAASPSLFVHLVTLAYRARSEPKHQLEERETALARHAWWVLNHWDAMPGQRDDGTIDGELLSRWVREARLALADEDRADIGDEEVGRVLAASPDGADGAWPAEPVRDLVDSIGSTHLETGLHVGRMNSRGVTTRGVYDGGEQERALSKNYRDWAQLTEPRWPRIGRVLRRLAEDYERQAHREDARAEVTADTE